MFEHERSLVQKYEGRPFALLGVNADDDRETLRAAEKKHHLNWRSWWDAGGAIAGRWKVKGFPTLFLIDHNGVVREHMEGAPSNPKQLDEMIERLVKEAEGGKQASLSRR